MCTSVLEVARKRTHLPHGSLDLGRRLDSAHGAVPALGRLVVFGVRAWRACVAGGQAGRAGDIACVSRASVMIRSHVRVAFRVGLDCTDTAGCDAQAHG